MGQGTLLTDREHCWHSTRATKLTSYIMQRLSACQALRRTQSQERKNISLSLTPHQICSRSGSLNSCITYHWLSPILSSVLYWHWECQTFKHFLQIRVKRNTPQYLIVKTSYVTTTCFDYFGLLSFCITYYIPSETTIHTAKPLSLNCTLCKQLHPSSWPAFHYYFHWVIEKALRARQRWCYPPPSSLLSQPTSQKEFWMHIPRHFQPRQPLPASCMRSSTEQHRDCEEAPPQVQTGADEKPQMKWGELNSNYFNLQLLIIKYYLWIFMDYNLTWDLHHTWQKQTPNNPQTHTQTKQKKPKQTKKTKQTGNTQK